MCLITSDSAPQRSVTVKVILVGSKALRLPARSITFVMSVSAAGTEVIAEPRLLAAVWS